MQTAVAEPSTSSLIRADAPGWPHWFGRAIGRLPVPFLGYAALAVVTTFALELRPWVAGRLPVGTLDTNSLTFGLSVTAMAYIFRYLEQSAAAAFRRFQPALAAGADGPRIARDLAVLPPRPALAALAASIALTSVRYALDPASSEVDGLPAWVVAIAFIVESVNVGLLFSLVTQLARQTWAIRRTLATDTIVDIYRPGPLHALSGLSARMGIALVLLTGTITVFVAPTSAGGALDVATLVPFVVLPTAIAILTFLVPLYGTHGRLVEEKERLQAATDIRLQGLVNEINGLIDGRRLGEVDPLNKALGAVIQQRDFVNRLSTWPWSPGTGRALVTAILLPIGLFVAQRLVSAGLGLH